MKLIGLLLLVGLAGAGWWALGAFESDPPLIQTRTNLEYVGSQYAHDFTVNDAGRGVEALRVWVETADGPIELVSTSYEGTWHSGAQLNLPRRVQVTLDPKARGLPDGKASLVAEATDFSFRRNTVRVEIPLVVDLRAPRVNVATGLTYVRRGGSEAVVYELDEPSERHGVQVGSYFFPGFVHPENPKQFVALYALPHDVAADVIPAVVANDRAGNETRVPLATRVIESRPTTDRIELSDGFMRAKIAELKGGEPEDVLTAYLEINRGMRSENAKKIREICGESSEERLWTDTFLQMPNSKVGAGFAEARSYLYAGRVVDQQTHLGFDLASTARAEIPAANDGVVVYADDLGIYGRTVIIDHGLSLFSLYGHLSEIGVDRGQAIVRGQAIGRSGTTGLAGGDHLHFGMLVAGTFVDPLEWFDPKWIDEHLEAKLSLRKPEEESDDPLDVPAAPLSDGA